MKPAKAEMLMMASIQSMTSPQRKAPVCGAGACWGIQFVLVDFVPKKKNPAWASGVFKVDVGASQQRGPTEYIRQVALSLLLGLKYPPAFMCLRRPEKVQRKTPAPGESGV
jgi:hypothetical protein